jgi:hypothetical protein
MFQTGEGDLSIRYQNHTDPGADLCSRNVGTHLPNYTASPSRRPKTY